MLLVLSLARATDMNHLANLPCQLSPWQLTPMSLGSGSLKVQCPSEEFERNHADRKGQAAEGQGLKVGGSGLGHQGLCNVEESQGVYVTQEAGR